MIRAQVILKFWDEMRDRVPWLRRNSRVRVVSEMVACEKHQMTLLLIRANEEKAVTQEERKCMIEACVMLLNSMGVLVGQMEVTHLEGKGPKFNSRMN